MDFSGKKKKDLKITPGFQAFLDKCGSNKVDNDLSTVEKWLFDQEVSPLSSPVRSLIRKNKVGNKVGKGYKPLFEYKQKPYLSSNSSINCDSYSIVSAVDSEKKRFKAMMDEDDDAEDALFAARIAAIVLENKREHNESRKAGCPHSYYRVFHPKFESVHSIQKAILMWYQKNKKDIQLFSIPYILFCF